MIGGRRFQKILGANRVMANKPMLNQVNDTLLNLQLAGKHDAKPTPEELKDWLHSGQVDVLKISTK
jgi:hypothetical protein